MIVASKRSVNFEPVGVWLGWGFPLEARGGRGHVIVCRKESGPIKI